ncbi:MAG: hypothetical protein Q9182_006880 [Xanthomendoza sp. 2 TL-2023]
MTIQSSTKAAHQRCKDAKVIVANGDFETGSLAPWMVLSSTPDPKYYLEYFSFNVTSPGLISEYAFTMTDFSATTFVQVSIGQTVPVCPGQKYELSAVVAITDGHNLGPTKEQYMEISVDGFTIVSVPESYIQGPPFIWISLSGTFTAKTWTAVVMVTFTATNILTAQWGVDNVIITPIKMT